MKTDCVPAGNDSQWRQERPSALLEKYRSFCRILPRKDTDPEALY